MKKMVQIDVEAFATPDGKPTCALVWGRECCPFVRSAGVCGTRTRCGVNEDELFRDEDGEGYLRPSPGCIVWGSKS